MKTDMEIDDMEPETVKQCHFDDGCVVPILAELEGSKWKLYRTKIMGQGVADLDGLLVEDEFDNVVEFNAYDGISHIAVCKDNRWGLIQLDGRFNPIICAKWNFKWKWLDNMSCANPQELHELIEKYHLNSRW
jgi:hypothetical protein